MNLQSIFMTNGVGCVILVILLICSHMVRLRRQGSDKLFTLMIMLTASACVIEPLTFYMDGRALPYGTLLVVLGNSYLYIMNAVVSYLWLVYVDLRMFQNNRRIRSHYVKYAVPALLAVIAVILNFRFQFLFCVDDYQRYHRLPLGYAYISITALYLVASLVVRRIYYNKCGRNRFFPIYMFIAPIVIGAAVQGIEYGVSLGWCSVSLGLVGLYMSIQNELSYSDPLTKLYNRNYLGHIMNEIVRKKNGSGGVMIDLDYFKSINDNFGHTIGDQALVDAAQLIKSTVPPSALTVRYAGDEFIVIVYSDDERLVREMIDRLRTALVDFNATSRRQYKLSFSIGYAMYTPGMDADQFLHKMDTDMYEEKRLKHSRDKN
ncbi:MAG: GGDEF domain-containing protein [Ruminococcus sp.]|nr:GGDEF domain-containing protein [Ruminococcus sp.]